jgi:hypothetical protein
MDKSARKKTVVVDSGEVREYLLNKTNCFFEEEEIALLKDFVSRRDKPKFEKSIFGKRIESRSDLLRMMFSPFTSSDSFVKYSRIDHVRASLVHRDKSKYDDFVFKFSKPVFYIDSYMVEIDDRKVVEMLSEIASSKTGAEYQVKKNSYFEPEMSSFEQIFISSAFSFEIDDITMLINLKHMRRFGDDGVSMAGRCITNTPENKMAMLTIISMDGVFPDIFETQIQFSAEEIRKFIIPKMKWGHIFERMLALSAIKMIYRQESVNYDLLVEIISKMSGNKSFFRMIKTNRQIRSKFKNDPAALLLIAIN